MMMPTIKRMESPVLPLAASPVGHERGAIVFRAARERFASEVRILDLPALNRIASPQRSAPAATVALSTARGSMPAMTGPGHAANSIERFRLNYWLNFAIRPQTPRKPMPNEKRNFRGNF